MPEIDDAPTVPIGSAVGDLVAYNAAAASNANPFVRIPSAAIATAVAKANSALQDTDVGGAAFEPADAYVRVSAHAAAIADLTTQITSLTATVAQLSALVGSGSIAVFASDVYEPGVFV